MIKTLILTEKPSVARDIATVLGTFTKKDGFLENEAYIISWAFGHLVQLAEPQEYNQRYAKWNLNQLPIIPEKFKFVASKDSMKQLKVLEKLMNFSEVNQIVNACDAGREGELIFRRIYQFCQCQKTIKRLWLSEATDSAVKASFENLKEGQEMENLAAAAEARSQADWLAGINASRAFTLRHNVLFSVGRVQTPTLALVVNREREINNFTPQKYWEIWAEFCTKPGPVYRGKWVGGENGRLFKEDQVKAILERLKSDENGTVSEIKPKEVHEQPPLLFNLNDLQKEANKRYGLTAQQTLDTAQALYEKHKLLTYPRTDSRHLTKGIASETINQRLKTIAQLEKYSPLIPTKLPKLSKRYVDDSKVTDHHAIIPTTQRSVLSRLSANERAVYDLVVKRFLAIFYPDARYALTTVNTKVGDEKFISKGKMVLDLGWRKIYQDESAVAKEDSDQDNQILPPLSQGETVRVDKMEALDKQTKPPKRYTEATLLSSMENAGRYIENKEMASCLKDAGGIGTPATRAGIIERLISVGYMERKKKILLPTEKGENLIDLVPDLVKSVDMTAEWEDGLRRIQTGEDDAVQWLKKVKNLTKDIVKIAKKQEATNNSSMVEGSLGKCPICEKAVCESKLGYSCSGYKQGCKFVIWKKIAEKKISLKQAKQLLTQGETDVLKGFKSKEGKPFQAKLKLTAEGKVTFAFENEKRESLGKCPLCKRDVVESAKAYGCSGWREGCKFVVWKEISGCQITVAQAKEIIEKGKTNIIEGFKSKSGKSFAASLCLNDQGRIIYDFNTNKRTEGDQLNNEKKM